MTMLFIYEVLALLTLSATLFVHLWSRASVGTKSLLLGVHAFWWHPITVWIAWVKLYKQWPDWRVCVCIFIHDFGYWGCKTMDGPDGMLHPAKGAAIANKLFGCRYFDLVFYHSRHLAHQRGQLPSLLCWPDKLSMMYDPVWFYLLRANLSGEIVEYHENAVRRGFIKPEYTQREWLHKLRNYLAVMAKEESKNFTKRCHLTTK